MTSPAYNYFLDRIESLETKDKKITARKLGTEFPQYLQYERVKELVNSAILYYPLFVGVGNPSG